MCQKIQEWEHISQTLLCRELEYQASRKSHLVIHKQSVQSQECDDQEMFNFCWNFKKKGESELLAPDPGPVLHDNVAQEHGAHLGDQPYNLQLNAN